jgi:hypothetical protein
VRGKTEDLRARVEEATATARGKAVEAPTWKRGRPEGAGGGGVGVQ